MTHVNAVGTLERIVRYPVKGLSGQRLNSVELASGQGVPHDREYAFALPGTPFDAENPKPMPKTKFAVLMRYEALAELEASFAPEGPNLQLSAGGETLASGNLVDDTDKAALEAVINRFAGIPDGETVTLYKGKDHRFTDISVLSREMMNAVSILNTASLRELEHRLGHSVDMRRFRGNFIVDLGAPWVELDMVGQQLSIGDVTLEICSRTKRCPATEVNPVTFERDLETPKLLREHYGHQDFGVYATVKTGGTIDEGDHVTTIPG